MTPLHYRQFIGNMPTVIPRWARRAATRWDTSSAWGGAKRARLVDPGEMVTHNMAFDDVKAAYDMYENREDEVVKVVMSG